MMKSNCFISVVVPLRNNAVTVRPFVQEVLKVLHSHYENYELILVDDFSTDTTAEEVNKLLSEFECIRYICLSRAFGVEIAITAGLDSSIGDFVVSMELGLDPPAEIPKMVDLARSKRGIVIGVVEKKTQYSFVVRAISPFFNFLCNKLMKFYFPRNTSYFWVLSRQAVNSITKIRQKSRYFRIFVSNVGYHTILYKYAQISQVTKSKKLGVFSALSLGFSMIISNSIQPLRFVSILGIIGSAIALFSTINVVVYRLLSSQVVPGWASISCWITSLFFINFVILSVLCEYIGRVLEETKDKPLYNVMEEKHSSVSIANETRRNVFEESIDTFESNKKD